MSVAAPTSTETKSVSSPPSLWTTGLVGGVYVLAALAVVFYAVPRFWRMAVSSWLVPLMGNDAILDGALLAMAVIAAFVALAYLGVKLTGPNPPSGIRGSVFLGMATIVTGLLLVRGTLMTLEQLAGKFEIGALLVLTVIGACLFLFYKFLASDRFPRWSVGLESAGWFDFKSYKRHQGIRVRRFTILGVLLLFGSGVYAMWHNNVVPRGDWAISLPMTDAKITLLPNAQLTVPFVLLCLSIWFAWRIVNYPIFADFLVATEAEINKVSWTPRAKLIKDTIVVLISVFIITLFLFLVDIFWGWILSREFVGVLPSKSETQKKLETKQINKDQY